MQLVGKASQFQAQDVGIAQCICRLEFVNMNGTAFANPYPSAWTAGSDDQHGENGSENQIGKPVSDELYNTRHIDLIVHAPVASTLDAPFSRDTQTTARCIGPFLHGSSLNAILQLKPLRSIDLVCVLGQMNVSKNESDNVTGTFKDDIVKNLRPLKGLALGLFDSYTTKCQGVEIHIWLQWGEVECEDTMLE